MAETAPILTIRNVEKRFGGVVAVRDANLDVLTSKVTSVIGPNGAGKTTLFNAVTGTLPATAGTITYHGAPGAPQAIQTLRPDQIARLGIARTFQNIRLFGNLSVLDNVKIGFHHRTHSGPLNAALRLPRLRREEKVVESSARACLEWCGLGSTIGERASSLPYGLQRRLEIARALATNPKLLLLDEPAAGMNPSESRDLLEFIRHIVSVGITVLLIEHDMRVVMNISDHIYVLDHGEVIASGGPADIRNNPKVVEAYLGKGVAAAH